MSSGGAWHERQPWPLPNGFGTAMKPARVLNSPASSSSASSAGIPKSSACIAMGTPSSFHPGDLFFALAISLVVGALPVALFALSLALLELRRVVRRPGVLQIPAQPGLPCLNGFALHRVGRGVGHGLQVPRDRFAIADGHGPHGHIQSVNAGKLRLIGNRSGDSLDVIIQSSSSSSRRRRRALARTRAVPDFCCNYFVFSTEIGIWVGDLGRGSPGS